MYYNHKRAHSTLGYLSPFEYERQMILFKQEFLVLKGEKMGVDAQIVNTNNDEIVEVLPDINSHLSHLVEENYNNQSSICLRFIEPYGLTMFNQLQLPYFIRELEEAISRIKDRQVKEHCTKFLLLAKKYENKPDRNLQFLGE